jgi:ubiquinone/menaquinone biosynthesis C-methylase UbiE
MQDGCRSLTILLDCATFAVNPRSNNISGRFIVSMRNISLAAATKAWDVSAETPDQINARIHDGVDLSQLAERADAYVAQIKKLFPYVQWNAETVLEIGPGVGFIMEAVERAAGQKAHITGLDISTSMIEAAKARLGDRRNFSFVAYDGVTMPFPDASFDFVYSFAALQHIPKPHVYNLFFEIKRVLKPTGIAILHFLPFSCLSRQEAHWPWRKEIDNQINSISGPHWHHFYSDEELRAVLGITGFKHVDVASDIFACIAKNPIGRLPAKSSGLLGWLASTFRQRR